MEREEYYNSLIKRGHYESYALAYTMDLLSENKETDSETYREANRRYDEICDRLLNGDEYYNEDK